MKLLLLLLLWNRSAPTLLTDTIPAKNKIFNTTIVTAAAQKETGYFYAVDDSAISLTAAPMLKRNPASGMPDIRRFGYADIDYVRFRRKGGVGRGALYGAAVGLGAGVVTGFIEGDDTHCFFCFSAEEKAALYGASFGLIGGTLGLLIGAVARKKFSIGGKREKFQEMKTTVLQKVYGRR